MSTIPDDIREKVDEVVDAIHADNRMFVMGASLLAMREHLAAALLAEREATVRKFFPALEALDLYRYYVDATEDDLMAEGWGDRAAVLAFARAKDPYDGITPTIRSILAAFPEVKP